MSARVINTNLETLHSNKCRVHGLWIGEGECQTCKRTREQRRYEIARDVMSGLLANGGTDYDDLAVAPRRAVQMADALLKALEESSDGES